MLGSCFSENIGAKFDYYKFRTNTNPFGILFHPKALETFLWMATRREQYVKEDLFNHQELWHCFDAHSSLSGSEPGIVVSNLNASLTESFERITSATHVIITLGTAWVYRLKDLDMIVANCHKIPQSEFNKELLSVAEIIQCLHHCIQLITAINPEVHIIFTVSPVRHQKDGFVENTRSKSHLLTALHETLSIFKNASYFPSYEIVMDELRDYRFYSEDMLHPNTTAIQYIWERFVETWIDEGALYFMEQIMDIQKGIAHQPFHPESEEHQQFLHKLELKKAALQRELAFLHF